MIRSWAYVHCRSVSPDLINVYGQPSQLSTIGNRYYFTGREYDEESGLYHYRARAYSPTIGRFLQRDPIGYYDSMNLFSYVNNSPTNFTDPLGWTPFVFRPPYDPEVDRSLNQNYQNSYNDLANSKSCEKKPMIRPRELDTFTQISWGLGGLSSGFRGPEWSRWVWRGKWYEGWHFHLGWGSLSRHHLPQQLDNWLRNFINLLMRR